MRPPDRSAKVLRGIGWLGSSSLAQSALRVGLMVILARLLAPEVYGLIALATAVVALVEIVARLGIEQALIQRASLTAEILSAAFSFVLFSALVATGLLIALAGPIAHLLGGGAELSNIIRLMALMLPVGAMTMVPRALLSRQAEFRYLGVTELISYSVASFAVAIPMALMGWGVWALACSALVQPMATMILLGRREKLLRAWDFDFAKVRDLFSFGMPLTGAKLANFVALQADNLVVGRFLGVAALGAYTRAYSLNTLPASMLAQAVDRSLFPTMSSVQADKGAVNRALMRGSVALLVIFPPLSAYCFVYAEDIIALLLGSQWTQAVIPFQILSVTMYFRVAYKLPDIAMRAAGRTDLILRAQIVYAVLVVAASLIGVRFGLTGVAIAVAAAILLQYVQTMSQVVCLFRTNVLRLVSLHLVALTIGMLTYELLYQFKAYGVKLISQHSHFPLSVVLLVALYGVIVIFIKPIFGEHGDWWRKSLNQSLSKN